MIGVLVTAFWLIPEVGLARTAGLCAVLNLACAGAALTLAATAPLRPQIPARPAQQGVLAVLAATGLLGIGYEVLVVRILSQVAEDTVYTFAILLAVYLVGSALGAAAYQRWCARTAAQNPGSVARPASGPAGSDLPDEHDESLGCRTPETRRG